MLADLSMDPQTPDANPDKLFALWLRYQSTNDRAFHRCLDQLLKLRAQRFKERLDEAALSQRAEDVKKAFERKNHQADSDARKLSRERERAELGQTAETRRAATEKRKQDLHPLAVCLAEAKVHHQRLLNESLDPSYFRLTDMQNAA
jgi:hypothetical protein